LKRRELLVHRGLAPPHLSRRVKYGNNSLTLHEPNCDERNYLREMQARIVGAHRFEEVVPAPTLFKDLAAHRQELSTLLNCTAIDPADELRAHLTWWPTIAAS
jgi:hypothetical protein